MTRQPLSSPVRLSLVLALALLVSGTAVAADPVNVPPIPQTAARPPLALPEGAVHVAPDIYYLGTALDYGRLVQGFALLCKGDGPTAPDCRDGTPSPGDGAGGASSLYDALTQEVGWRRAEPYLVNPSNAQGLAAEDLLAALAQSIATWEGAAGADILGGGWTTALPLLSDLGSPDGLNEVYLGALAEPDVTAMTVVWGAFGGPPTLRALVEWDLVLSEDVAWSVDGRPGRMDLGSVVVRELGRAVGLVGLYARGCSG